MRKRGYYINSLKAWRAELMSEQKRNIARLLHMEKMKHPDAPDQKALIELRGKFIGMIAAALAHT